MESSERAVAQEYKLLKHVGLCPHLDRQVYKESLNSENQ